RDFHVTGVQTCALPIFAFAEVGRGYEIDEMVDAAFAVAREGGPLGDMVARLRTLFHETTLPVAVHAYDGDALAAVAARVSDEVKIGRASCRERRQVRVA